MKIKSLDVLQSTKFLNFYQLTYETNTGSERKYYFTSRNSVDELVCLKNRRNSIITPNAIEAFTYIDNDSERCVVMIKEFRMPLNSYVYSFPAGLVELGESPDKALVREVSEEVGGDIQDFKFLQNYPMSMCAGLSDESNMLALVRLNSLGDQHLDVGENIEVVKFDPDDLYNKIKSNEITLTASGLLGATIILNKLGKNISYLFD